MIQRRRAVFFDRDGVLNEVSVKNGKPFPPRSVADLRITPGADSACRKLKAMGFSLAVITNQPDIARQRMQYSAASEINDYLQKRLGLDSIWMCPHDDSDGCQCRKPAPGLILQAAAHHAVNPESSYVVGDRWRDIGAGRAAGCRTVLILDQRYTEPIDNDADFVASNLTEAVDWIARSLPNPASKAR